MQTIIMVLLDQFHQWSETTFLFILHFLQSVRKFISNNLMLLHLSFLLALIHLHKMTKKTLIKKFRKLYLKLPETGKMDKEKRDAFSNLFFASNYFLNRIGQQRQMTTYFFFLLASYFCFVKPDGNSLLSSHTHKVHNWAQRHSFALFSS